MILQVLCHFINTIKPGTVKKVETSALAFKQMVHTSTHPRIDINIHDWSG